MIPAGYPQRNDDAQFGHANIPFGVISTRNAQSPRIATRIGGQVFRLPDLIDAGYLENLDSDIKYTLYDTKLNRFASLGRQAHREVRLQLQNLLKSNSLATDQTLASYAIPIKDVVYHLPVSVGDFSDFSCSKDHVLNAGEAVMGIRQLPPGFLHFPVGYTGRSASILAPGSSVYRPQGQYRSSEGVSFGYSKAVDFELEVACVIGKPSSIGNPIDISEAQDHIFGFLLLNDWSARDIQGLEMNPLGPFNGKSFGTSVSPWVITADAMEPYRVTGPAKEISVAPYLNHSAAHNHYGLRLDVELEAEGQTTIVCQSQLEWLYWTFSDMIAHQTINGCPLNAGDLLATGTVSGSTKSSHGCLLEITKGGKEPLVLADGRQMTYLSDNDGISLTATTMDGKIGFGRCYGKLLPGKNLTRPLKSHDV